MLNSFIAPTGAEITLNSLLEKYAAVYNAIVKSAADICLIIV